MSQLPLEGLSLSFASLETQRRARDLQRLLDETHAIHRSCTESCMAFHGETVRFNDTLRDAYANLRVVNLLLARARGPGLPPGGLPAQ